MADAKKIRARIVEIATRPQNVTLADIEWVMGQLGQFGHVEVSGNVHMKLWRFEDAIFSVCTHRGGGKQIKAIYVRNFLNAMIKTGWYE